MASVDSSKLVALVTRTTPTSFMVIRLMMSRYSLLHQAVETLRMQAIQSL